MRKVNLLFATFFGLGLAAWLIFSDLGGYTSRSAMIMARSTSVVSTIDGEVADLVATVGSKVSAGSLLVTIENDRIDRSRLTELRSQRAFLEREIVTVEAQSAELGEMMQSFLDKASAYLSWMTQDLEILRRETFHRLAAAKEVHAASAAEVERKAQLFRESHVSVAILQQASSDAAVAHSQMEALQAELARIDLRVASVKSAGVLRENGDTSYWDEVRNTLEMRRLDNRRQTATMTAKLAQVEDQILVEHKRLEKTFTEDHRAQFDGIINAVLTSEGERVIVGANLLEILDCASPIAIVSVPDHRFGDFYIGQKATISPLDSEEEFIGAVQHISSDALISRDTSIAASADLKVGGNKVTVAFQNRGGESASAQSCDSARRAVVTIETDTLLGHVGGLLARLFGDEPSGGLLAQTAASGPDQ